MEAIWVKADVQITALTKVVDALSERLVEFLDECLARLLVKLTAANLELDKVSKIPTAESTAATLAKLSLNARQKIRYSAVEHHLKATINDLESWHAIFDPTWLLIALPTNGQIDSALEQEPSNTAEVESILAIRDVLRDGSTPPTRVGSSVFKAPSFVTASEQKLAFSNLYPSTLASDDTPVILDTTSYDTSSNQSDIRTDVRNFARILSSLGSTTLGLLPCAGVTQLPTSGQDSLCFQFIYTPPASMAQPRTLRELLIRSAEPSLDVKFDIAKFLARAIALVHSAGFVHNSVRPDTVLTFENADGDVDSAFLVGFERFRAARSSTVLQSDMLWHRNLYRHPTRQGQRPEDLVPYMMQHDIYSLGVCLLELAMWKSFIDGSEVEPVPGSALSIEKQLSMSNATLAAREIQTMLIDLAKAHLPRLVGQLFTQVVLTCLTCLDEDAVNMFGSERSLWDEDGTLVGVVFIEKILTSLESISIAGTTRTC